MRFFILIISTIFLSGCINQNQADVKMSAGCQAGINALLGEEGKEIAEIKVKRYADEQTEGGLHRRITFEAIEKDGWLELEKEYSCLFMQEWGLFKTSHKALLVQIKIDDALYGKKDGKIIGSFEDFLNLTKVTDSAMSQ